MRCGSWVAALSATFLALSAPARAEVCEPERPVQMGLMSGLPLVDHAVRAFSLPPLASRAAAAPRRLQSLEEFESRWRAIDQFLRSMTEDQMAAFMRKAAPLLAGIQPKSELEFEYIHAITFMGRKGWALEWHGQLHETDDAGVTWTSRRVPVPRSGPPSGQARTRGWPATDEDALRALEFVSLKTGFALGHRGVMSTADGGATWLQLGNPSRNALLALSCVADGTCWVGGHEPTVVYARRAGTSVWEAQATPMLGATIAIHFIDAKVGWAVGDSGEIAATRDGGAHWTLQHADRNTRLWSVFFLDTQHGWAAGENGTLLRTDDGGTTWTAGELAIPASLPRYMLRLHAVRFLDAQTGWAAGINGVTLGTTDGGRCWRVVRNEGIAPMLTVYALAVSEGPVVWAAGNGGNIMASRDKGRFWFPVRGIVLKIGQVFEQVITGGR